MPRTYSGKTRGLKGSTGTAGVQAPPTAKAAPLRASADPASLEQRLQRARLLGHRPGAIAAAGTSLPPPRPEPAAGGPSAAVGGLLRSAVAERIQRAIGFELEMQVLLSSGPPKGAPQEEGDFPLSVDDLAAGKIQPRPEVEGTQHTVVLTDGSVYSWDAASAVVPDDLTAIKPANAKTAAGRWLLKPGVEEQNRYFDPLLKKEEKIHRDDLLEVVQDHAPLSLGMGLSSIPELVVSPRDEMLPEEEFLKPIKTAQKVADAIVGKTGNLKKRAPASEVFPEARSDLYLGLEDDGEIPVENYQKPAAGTQATYAVQLGAVPSWLGSMIAKGAPQRALPAEVKIIDSALAAARSIMQQLIVQGSVTTPDPGLLGFLTVLSLYLTGGAIGDDLGNVKNYVPLLNRNDLQFYVSQAGFLGWDAVKLFRYAARRWSAAKLIASANGRSLGEPVLLKSEDSPKVGEWLEEVLTGEGDPMRSYSRFGRSKRISHEKVGPEKSRTLAPVFEERQVPGSGILGREDLLPISAWEEMARSYQRRLREANKPLPDTTSGASSSSNNNNNNNNNNTQVLPALDYIVRSRLADISGEKMVEEPLKKGDKVSVKVKLTGETKIGTFLATGAGNLVVEIGGEKKLFKATEVEVARV